MKHKKTKKNLKKKLTQKLISTTLATLTFCASFQAMADFAVKSEAPCLPYPAAATIGAPVPQPCDPKGYVFAPEQAEYLRLLPEPEDDRFYLRISANYGSYNLKAVVNRSITLPERNGTVQLRSTKKNHPGSEFALGFVWTPIFRTELEYLAIQHFYYNVNPVLGNVPIPRALSATIEVNPILFNLYYDIQTQWLGCIKPFIMAGFGLSVNRVRTVLNPVTDTPGNILVQPQQALAFAYTVGAGFRYQFLPRWYVNTSIRYTDLSAVKMKSSNGFRIDGLFSQTAISLGLMYLF